MTKMMTFHVPQDRDLLAEIGEVALRHEHLNHILRMTIKTLARLDVNEALDATAYDSSSQLRDRIKNWPANDSGKANLCSSFKRSLSAASAPPRSATISFTASGERSWMVNPPEKAHATNGGHCPQRLSFTT